ncbi:MAG TPA: hypothetical protein VF640_10500 [Acidimicrobiales bacterium]|jgi:hypothetical protein
MGKASSAKKVARAAKAGKARRPSSRSWSFPAAIATVLIAGVALVVVARAGNDEAGATTPPRIGLDHWHAAYGIYDCDAFLPPITDQNDPLGIHTHGDGVVHIHPTSSRAAGEDARFGVFADAAGIDISDDEVKVGDTTLSEEDGCDGEPAQLVVKRWNVDDPDDEGEEFTSDLRDVRFTADRQAITVALLPEGADVPEPESIPTLDQLTDVPSASTTFPSITQPPDATGTTGTLPGGSTSSTDTTAADGSSTTATTAADDASTTSTAGSTG